ncbi:hypothetical protein OF83DRAFT_1068641 [Amylostereum chailletii]|nr:hypothetical protein OF83DRAFT_1068641 [Amylostereum chailletii]
MARPTLSTLPPLKGDGDGRFRIHIVGNSEQSTLARELSAILDIPHIALDAFFWKPGWEKSTNEELKNKIREALSRSPRGWIIDGNYIKRAGEVFEPAVTDKIWLDPPLVLYFPRIFVRTFLRILRLRAPCSPGCDETIRENFSKKSILLWCLQQHTPVRERNRKYMELNDVRVGGKMRRLGGWGGEQREWVEAVKESVRRR